MHPTQVYSIPCRLLPVPDVSVTEPFDCVLARLLDRQADHALHLGYRLQAERLAHRAAELREGAQ